MDEVVRNMQQTLNVAADHVCRVSDHLQANIRRTTVFLAFGTGIVGFCSSTNVLARVFLSSGSSVHQ